MDDLFLCDADILNPCDPAAFSDAGITLLLILVLAFCVSLIFERLRN